MNEDLPIGDLLAGISLQEMLAALKLASGKAEMRTHERNQAEAAAAREPKRGPMFGLSSPYQLLSLRT